MLEVKDLPIVAGEQVTIESEDEFRRTATVQWVEGDGFGVKFDQPCQKYGSSTGVDVFPLKSRAA